MRWAIRVLAALACIAATWLWYESGNKILIFTAVGFLLTFLGTFIIKKPAYLSSGTIVNQESGAFSNNHQSVNINEPTGNKKD